MVLKLIVKDLLLKAQYNNKLFSTFDFTSYTITVYSVTNLKRTVIFSTIQKNFL